jgi:hypothetical protein
MRASREHANALRGEGKALPLFKEEFVDYLRPAVMLSLLTGIRRGAFFALVWGDIDFSARTVTLRGDDAKDGKTHVLPLCDDAVDILSSWQRQSENIADDDLIFPSPKKRGQQISEIKTALGALLKAADIKDFRWHDLRHSFASSLVQAGVDLNTVRELLTHSDIKMMMRYAHLAPENKLQAVQVLNRPKGKIIGRIRKTSRDMTLWGRYVTGRELPDKNWRFVRQLQTAYSAPRLLVRGRDGTGTGRGGMSHRPSQTVPDCRVY